MRTIIMITSTKFREQLGNQWPDDIKNADYFTVRTATISSSSYVEDAHLI